LSSKLQKNITYSINNWGDIINKYDLKQEMEIVIRKEGATSNSNKSTYSTKLLLIRSVAITGIIVLLGNLPIQSHFNVSQSSYTSSFEIIPTASQPITPHIAIQTISLDIDKVDRTLPPEKFILPKKALETFAVDTVIKTRSKWATHKVKSYDNLTNIFHNLGHKEALKPLMEDMLIAQELEKLKKGSIVRASSRHGELFELIFTHDNVNSYVITKTNGKFIGRWKRNIFEIRQARASYTIENGLFYDGREAGIANKIIKQLVKVFDWDIDFSRDVRVGDKVTAVFEDIYHDGDKVGTQHLLAAEFTNQGKDLRAIRYTNKDGTSGYFTPQGREMKKAFLRTPLIDARVSSHFNPGRFHPVLHKIRAHKGTDFAAKRGTPIMATGNGKVITLGRKGGYGRTVIIRHREGYTTTYAHMSRYKKNLKQGQKVNQGDIIGYVGSSGLATGPHLHYEFHKDKKAVNAMTVSLPNSMSLSRAELQDFRNKAINLVLQLNVLHRFVEAEIEIDSVIGG
jgi:murein DD-endopeptidase MepM/ murein hydrolase activator NlpD